MTGESFLVVAGLDCHETSFASSLACNWNQNRLSLALFIKRYVNAPIQLVQSPLGPDGVYSIVFPWKTKPGDEKSNVP